jgi:hypothetical protein
MQVFPGAAKQTNHLVDTNILGKFSSYFLGKNYFLTKDIIFNGQPFGGIILALIPFSFLTAFGRKNILTLLFIFMVYAIGMILIQPPYPRHILPALAFLAIPASLGFFYLYENFRKVKYLFLILLMLSFLFHLEGRLKSFTENDLPFISGFETEEEYLDRMLYSTEAHMDKEILQFVNTKTNKEDKILLLYFGRTFYIDRMTVFDTYLPEPFVFREKDADLFIKRLKNIGINYVWYSETAKLKVLNKDHLSDKYQHTLLTEQEFQNNFLELTFRTENEYLFKLK